MPQEFQVLQCYQCKVFQVHQVKKVQKWACKMCGEKQSIKKVHMMGTGADCRKVVQDFNMKRGQALENVKEEEHLKYNDDDEQSSLGNGYSANSENAFQEEQKENKWEKYTEFGEVDENGSEGEHEDHFGTGDVYTSYTWQRQPTNRKRKRNEDGTNQKNENITYSKKTAVSYAGNTMPTSHNVDLTVSNKVKGHTGQSLYQDKPKLSGFDPKYSHPAENIRTRHLEHGTNSRSGFDGTTHISVNKIQNDEITFEKNISKPSVKSSTSSSSKWGQFCEDIDDDIFDEDSDSELNLNSIMPTSSAHIKSQVLENHCVSIMPTSSSHIKSQALENHGVSKFNNNICSASETASNDTHSTQHSCIKSSTSDYDGEVAVKSLGSSKWGKFMDEAECSEDKESDSDGY